ncbi:2-dehydropantoate 2-reductase [Arthrobacter sp. Sa2CUA1]|uniref:2-dehydropantoate 2-reductase n=1 Tax=Arthrobacter gallicola TaxID=2762225 RepID=A0ABR8UMS5_9MICC|nr:2-dehydropantoate 2-reductase [Arthrobacter gallicola]MBD7993849.1 2-dehydropantoate 2-reductase [Arthrobacter gallicola]
MTTAPEAQTSGNTLKIGIVGAGGVGAYFAAALARAGHEVHVVATPRHIEPIRTNGIRVTKGDGSDGFTARPASISTDAADIGVCDAVVVASKAGQVREALLEAKALVGTDTAVLPLQNGVSATQQITDAVGAGHALGGVCLIISYLTEPGIVHHVGGQPSITLGELNGKVTSRVERLAAALSDARVQTTISQHIAADMWRKFMLITSYGGVGALSREPVGRTRANPLSRSLVRDAMSEVAHLATAAGTPLDETDVEAMMRQYDTFDPSSTSSMQRDLAAGRPSELDEQTGAVVRIAAQYGVPVPIHDTIYRALKLRDG